MSHEHPPTAHGPEASHKEGQPTEAEKIEKFKTLPEEEKRRKIETIPKKPGETDEEHLRRKEEYLKAGSDEEYKKVLEELLHPDVPYLWKHFGARSLKTACLDFTWPMHETSLGR